MTEHEQWEIFLAWFVWRCRNYGIRSRWTRAVAESLLEQYDLDVDELAEKYDFKNIWKEFRPKGMFPND